MAHAEHAEHSNNGAVREIWVVTGILTVLTLVELGIGFYMMKVTNESWILALKGSIVILMMVKAFYIVAYFMHLKHELRNLIMTIVVPLALFIWFITAFLYEGNSYKNLRNTYDPYKKEQTTIKVEKKVGEHGEHSAEKHKAVE